jgi:hypothetical protein
VLAGRWIIVGGRPLPRISASLEFVPALSELAVEIGSYRCDDDASGFAVAVALQLLELEQLVDLVAPAIEHHGSAANARDKGGRVNYRIGAFLFHGRLALLRDDT